MRDNDQNRFFYEVDREQAEIDHANELLEAAAEDTKQATVDAMYSEFLQAMFRRCYEDIEVDVLA